MNLSLLVPWILLPLNLLENVERIHLFISSSFSAAVQILYDLNDTVIQAPK